MNKTFTKLLVSTMAMGLVSCEKRPVQQSVPVVNSSVASVQENQLLSFKRVDEIERVMLPKGYYLRIHQKETSPTKDIFVGYDISGYPYQMENPAKIEQLKSSGLLSVLRVELDKKSSTWCVVINAEKLRQGATVCKEETEKPQLAYFAR